MSAKRTESLDIIYLGCNVRIPVWDVLVLAPPTIDEMGGIQTTPFSKDSMKITSNIGMILKIGDRAFERWCVDENGKETGYEFPYRSGEWVFFEEFHPQARKINGRMVYFIPDTRIIAALPDLEFFDYYLLYEKKLPLYREDAKRWRALSKEERIAIAGVERLED